MIVTPPQSSSRRSSSSCEHWHVPQRICISVERQVNITSNSNPVHISRRFISSIVLYLVVSWPLSFPATLSCKIQFLSGRVSACIIINSGNRQNTANPFISGFSAVACVLTFSISPFLSLVLLGNLRFHSVSKQ